jgi:hypothetical protein
MAFFEDLVQIQKALNRQIEALGGVYSDPFNEVATVVSVSDPEELGRVKVTYQDGTTSDWAYVLGSNKGLLSAQFIGTPCLVGKAHGRSEDAFVLGFFNKSPDAGYPGSTLQIATLSEQLEVYRSPASPGDQGLRCNEGNSGKVYIFDNEISQDLVICLRRNNRQESNEQIWAWKSLTHGKWVEKGTDPGAGEVPTTSNFFEKPGIPKCTKSLEGEIHEFAEDRKFRSSMIMCRRDENGDFGWGPVSAPPLVFRTTLPKCDERVHGMEAIVDSGRDSELAICLRYQGEMKWIHHRTREPLQFYKKDPPPTRKQFIDGKTPMPALASQPATPASQDLAGKAGGNIINGFFSTIRPINSDPRLRAAMQAAGALPPSFNSTQVLSNTALTALSINSGVPIAQLTSQLTAALAQGGVIDSNLATALISAGGLGNIIAQGVKDNNLDRALQIAGQGALRQALTSVSPELGGIYTGYAAGGVLGAIDVATMIGATRLPPEISQYVAPLLSVGKGILGTQPPAFSNLLSASVGLGSQSLPGVISGLLGIAGQNGPIPAPLISGALSALQGGALGPIAQSLGGFAGLPGIPLIGGAGGVPQLATTALQLLGLGSPFSAFLGPAGLGLSAFAALTGINPITSILGAIPGLGGLFGGGLDCPCDPKCRKTSHGIDSDGIRLLHPCGSVIANSHSSYDPIGNPTENNQNRVAESVGRENTLVGEELCVSNPYDLTQMIKSVSRLGEMADRMEHAKHADWPEMWSEFSYTFETIQKAFKQTDNNITGIESVERKLIDAQYRLINKLMVGNGSILSKTLLGIVSTSKAIQDLYGFMTLLNAKKKGAKASIFATASLKTVFENITKIAALNAASKAEAGFIIKNMLSPADAEWKKLAPGLDLISLTDFILGGVSKDIPLSFNKCKTERDKNRILRDSLESKLNSLVPNESGSVIEAKLPSNVLNAAEEFDNEQLLLSRPDFPAFDRQILPGLIRPEGDQQIPPSPIRPGKEIKEILEQIKYNQDRTQNGQADC